MRHPTDGTLRRLLDEPGGVAEADRAHVAGCAVCLAALAAAREDAALIGAALHHEVTPDVDDAWRRLSDAAADNGPRPAATTHRVPRWRKLLRSPVVAGVAAVTLVAGATAVAANNWLPIFRTERVAPVTVTQADLLRLPDLSAYGDVEILAKADVRQVADVTAAQQVTGLSAPRVDKLPRGVTGEPTYLVGNQVSASFTFSIAKATQTAAAVGKPLPPPPAGLDGSEFRMTAGPGLAAVWMRTQGVPSMILVRAVAPAAFSTGIPFETARDYLLSLPGLPEDVASQLRGFSGAGTLPLIVKDAQETSSTADVNGMPATVLATRDGALAAVLWVDRGFVTAVAGSLSVDEVLSVARGLRWGR